MEKPINWIFQLNSSEAHLPWVWLVVGWCEGYGSCDSEASPSGPPLLPSVSLMPKLTQKVWSIHLNDWYLSCPPHQRNDCLFAIVSVAHVLAVKWPLLPKERAHDRQHCQSLTCHDDQLNHQLLPSESLLQIYWNRQMNTSTCIATQKGSWTDWQTSTQRCVYT